MGVHQGLLALLLVACSPWSWWAGAGGARHEVAGLTVRACVGTGGRVTSRTVRSGRNGPEAARPQGTPAGCRDAPMPTSRTATSTR